MYDFHYNFIKNNFDAELLFTDKDSITYEKVIGKLKDQFGGVIVIKFVGLKSKMYSIKTLMVKSVIQQKE